MSFWDDGETSVRWAWADADEHDIWLIVSMAGAHRVAVIFGMTKAGDAGVVTLIRGDQEKTTRYVREQADVKEIGRALDSTKFARWATYAV